MLGWREWYPAKLLSRQDIVTEAQGLVLYGGTCWQRPGRYGRREALNSNTKTLLCMKRYVSRGFQRAHPEKKPYQLFTEYSNAAANRSHNVLLQRLYIIRADALERYKQHTFSI